MVFHELLSRPISTVVPEVLTAKNLLQPSMTSRLLAMSTEPWRSWAHALATHKPRHGSWN